MLTLASQSPRRAELLRAAGVPFRVVAPPDGEVTPERAASFPALVKRLALAKAQAVASNTPGLVLGADTIVVCEGRILGKPSTKAEARRMLAFLSGKRHYVYTGVALVSGRQRRTDYERTEVTFRTLSDQGNQTLCERWRADGQGRGLCDSRGGRGSSRIRPRMLH